MPEPQKLPPTKDCLTLHLDRANFVVRIWKLLLETHPLKLNPTAHDRRQSGLPNQMDERKASTRFLALIFNVTAKLTIIAQNNLAHVDPMVLNVLILVHAQIAKTQ